MREMFTIGHSNHTVEHFISLLVTHNISAVADVRSSPYSEYSPQFNQETIQQKLRDANIEYVFLGRELGARRTRKTATSTVRQCMVPLGIYPPFAAVSIVSLKESSNTPSPSCAPKLIR
jgi:uncharacterized protein (DUF488 family)